MSEMPSKLITVGAEELLRTVKDNNISVLVFKTPTLKKIVDEKLNPEEETRIPPYSVFSIIR
jgi:hypothetical protein